MKIRFVTALCVVIACFSYTGIKAQTDSTHVREFGVGFNNLSSFNIEYQWGKPTTLFRISIASISFSNPSSTNIDTGNGNGTTNGSGKDFNISLSLKLGIIKIIKITPRFDFLDGIIVGSGLTYTDNTSNSYAGNGMVLVSASTYKYQGTDYSPFIGVVLGARYSLSKSFYVDAEIDPNISYSYSTYTSSETSISSLYPDYSKSTSHSINIGFSNLGASLTFVYRFSKRHPVSGPIQKDRK